MTVIVVGGGVIGVCSAYYLARRGFRVTLLERGEICTGSSAENAGLIVPSHSVPLAAPGVLSKALRWLLDPESPFYVKPRLSKDLVSWLWRFRRACTAANVGAAMPVLRDLHYASLDLYRELARIPDFDFGFAQRGTLEVYRTARGFAEGQVEARRLEQAGIPARVLDAAATAAREPALAPGVVGGVLVPDDAQVVPDRFVRGLARHGEREGVRIQTGREVTGFRRQARRILAVVTASGEVPCDAVVVAAGAWSPGLAKMLSLPLPLQPAKGYSLTGQRSPKGPARPLVLAEAKVAVTPMDGRIRFAGTLELTGLDLTVNERRVEAIRRAARTYLADPGELAAHAWSGLRPCTPDGLPVIGRPPDLENVVLATGHAMVGISTGPITGLLVAQILAGEPTALEIEPLSPKRFG